MIAGVESIVGQVLGQLSVRLGARTRDEIRARKAADQETTMMGPELADRAIDELDPDELAALNHYVSTPDFETAAIRLLAATWMQRRDAEQTVSAVREELREGIRHACGLAPDRLLTATDAVLAALRLAIGDAGVPNAGMLQLSTISAAGHLVAAAARNGRLLARLSELTGLHEQANRLRGQVARHYQTLSLPHTGLARSVPWERLYVQPVLGDEPNHADDLDVDQLWQPGSFTVVLGDPGAGKSTLAAKLAYDRATDASSHAVPFVVVLRDFAEALRGGERTLAEHLAVVAKAPHNVTMPQDTIEYLLLNGRAIVILDGLDELTDVSSRSRVAALVRGFVALFPTVPVLVTSRRVGYSEAALDTAIFRTCAIAPFDDERVARYAANWFELNESVSTSDKARLCQAFLRESSSIRDLRSNPLLLSLLCSMYATEQYIPRNRAQVYERCAVMVFDRWDSMRRITVPVEFEGKVRGAIQELAWRLFTLGGPAELARHKMLRIIADFLCSKHFDEDDARAMAQQFLDFCAGRAWVLAEVGATETEPIYGFAHRTFLEFFAAERLVRHNPTPEAVWRVLEPHVGDGAWEVVGQLAVQLLDRNVDDGAETLLKYVLDSSAELEVVAFAARAGGQVGLSPQLIDRITRAAVDQALRLPLDRRTHYWIDGPAHEAILAADGPLHTLMFQSLRGNLPFVQRALSARLSELAAGFDDTALYLITQLGRRLDADEDPEGTWASARERLQQAHSVELSAWGRLRPWDLLDRCTGDDPVAVNETVDRFGVSAFYLTDTCFNGTSFPRASTLLATTVSPPGEPAFPAAARALRDRLLTAARPWIPGDRWLAELGRLERRWTWQTSHLAEAAWPEGGEDLATFTVLALPYLETPLFGSVRGAPGNLWGLRHGVDDAGDAIGWIRSAYAPEIADMLLRWVAREFSVVGAPGTTEK